MARTSLLQCHAAVTVAALVLLYCCTALAARHGGQGQTQTFHHLRHLRVVEQDATSKLQADRVTAAGQGLKDRLTAGHAAAGTQAPATTLDPIHETDTKKPDATVQATVTAVTTTRTARHKRPEQETKDPGADLAAVRAHAQGTAEEEEEEGAAKGAAPAAGVLGVMVASAASTAPQDTNTHAHTSGSAPQQSTTHLDAPDEDDQDDRMVAPGASTALEAPAEVSGASSTPGDDDDELFASRYAEGGTTVGVPSAGPEAVESTEGDVTAQMSQLTVSRDTGDDGVHPGGDDAAVSGWNQVLQLHEGAAPHGGQDTAQDTAALTVAAGEDILLLDQAQGSRQRKKRAGHGGARVQGGKARKGGALPWWLVQAKQASAAMPSGNSTNSSVTQGPEPAMATPSAAPAPSASTAVGMSQAASFGKGAAGGLQSGPGALAEAPPQGRPRLQAWLPISWAVWGVLALVSASVAGLWAIKRSARSTDPRLPVSSYLCTTLLPADAQHRR